MRLSFCYLIRTSGGDCRLRLLRRDTRRWKPGDMMTVKIPLTDWHWTDQRAERSWRSKEKDGKQSCCGRGRWGKIWREYEVASWMRRCIRTREIFTNFWSPTISPSILTQPCYFHLFVLTSYTLYIASVPKQWSSHTWIAVQIIY